MHDVTPNPRRSRFLLLVGAALLLMLLMMGLPVRLQTAASHAQSTAAARVFLPYFAIFDDIGHLPLEIVGQIGGPTNAVDIVPPYAYIGVGLRLVVVDIADPTHPQIRGETQALPGIVHDVRVVGERAYVADEAGGLRVIDVSNPAAPRELGFADPPGDAYGVDVVGSLAYVADTDHGLRVIDVSNPVVPRQVGFLALPVGLSGGAEDVQVVGNLAYVADEAGGLVVIDVSNPAAPRELGSLNTGPWAARAVHVVGGMAYVADGYPDWTGGLHVIDVSNPAAPLQLGFVHTPRGARGVQVVGDLAYVADADSGLIIVKVR